MRTTRKAGTVAWKNRLTPRPTFIPRPTQASGRYLAGRSTRRRPGVTFNTCEHVKLIWPRRRRTPVRRLPVWEGGARPPSEVVDVRELVQWRLRLWRNRRGRSRRRGRLGRRRIHGCGDRGGDRRSARLPAQDEDQQYADRGDHGQDHDQSADGEGSESEASGDIHRGHVAHRGGGVSRRIVRGDHERMIPVFKTAGGERPLEGRGRVVADRDPIDEELYADDGGVVRRRGHDDDRPRDAGPLGWGGHGDRGCGHVARGQLVRG